MLLGNQYQKIYRMIKKYDTIVIARHTGPDPDAIASSLGLRDAILKTFPKKHVYAVGTPAHKFRYLGVIDAIEEDCYKNALLIITDTANKARIDGVDITRFQKTIKIDHHPYVETFCDYEWIDDTASSASQMVLELIYHTKLKMDSAIAGILFQGIVSDTDRFLFEYTTAKTFRLIARLLEDYPLNFNALYRDLYLRPIREVKFQGYIANHLTITENGLGYIRITDDILKEYGVDVATSGNLINHFNFIQEITTWTTLTEDKHAGQIRISIRSRGPVINKVAERFGGGGHQYASGVKLKNWSDTDEFIQALDDVCKEYKESTK